MREQKQQKAPQGWDCGCSLTLGRYSASLAGSAFALPPVLDEGSVAKLTALAGSY